MHARFDTLESRTLMSATPAIDLNNSYVGDLTGDHKADIATLRGGKLHLLVGTDGGIWRERAAFDVDSRLNHVAAGDFNGDGTIDLVATGIVSAADGTSNTLLIAGFLPHGPGAWDDADIVYCNRTLPRDSYDSVVGDFNGDGRDDIGLAGRSNGIIAILIGLFSDHQTFGQPQMIDSPFARGVHVAAGDVNGDGVADLVSLDSAGHSGVAIGAGACVFDDPFFFDAFTTAPTQRQLIGDVDGDGADDLACFCDGSVRVAKLMEEEGIFFLTGTNTNHLPPDLQANSAVADIDGNGKADLLAIGNDGRSFIAYTDERGIFTPTVSTQTERLADLLAP
jgi:hypothetical protein